MLTELEKRYKADDGSEFHLSLNKISGKKIKDIYGYVSNEFGEPSFVISGIIFEDNSTIGVEGEHDYPYLADYDNSLAEVLEKIASERSKE